MDIAHLFHKAGVMGHRLETVNRIDIKGVSPIIQ